MRHSPIAFMVCALLSIVSGQSAVPQATRVQVVMLGTGTPLPDPERSGPSIAVVVDNHAYLLDAGTGIVRRAAAVTKQKGIAGLEPRTLRVAFLTHLHSDHTLYKFVYSTESYLARSPEFIEIAEITLVALWADHLGLHQVMGGFNPPG